MASSEIQICSLALVELGDDPINSFDDGSGANGNNRGRACAALWPIVRQSVLRSYPWNCAKKKDTITPLSETPPFDYSYQFDLPTDWLRNIAINKRNAWEHNPFYKVVGRRIMTNQSTLFLTYIYDNTDVSSYDALLTDALVMHMASRLAMNVTGKAGVKELYEKMYRDKLREARNVDAQEESADQIEDHLVLDARDGRSRFYDWLPDFS